MQYQKRISLLLALALLFCLFTGCAKTEPAAEPAAEPVQETEPAAQEAPVEEPAPAEEPAEEPAPAEEPVPAEEPAEEPAPAEELASGSLDYADGLNFTTVPLDNENGTVLSLWLDQVVGLTAMWPNGFIDHPVFQTMQEQTGVQIEFFEADESTGSEKFRLMVASGDWTDMVLRMNYDGGLDQAVFDEFALDLTPYLEENAPNFTALMNMDDGAYRNDIVTADGNIVCFYSFNNQASEENQGILLRADWLEELGMEKPKTYDQMHDVLAAFRDTYGCTEPLMMAGETNALSMIAGYGTKGEATHWNSDMAGTATYYVNGDGQVCYGLLDESFRDYCQMLLDWMDEGLISSDYMENNDKQMSDLWGSNLATQVSGVVINTTSMIDDYQYLGEDAGIAGFRIEASPDLRLHEDDTLHLASRPSIVASQGITLTTTCQDIELACQWSDYWYSPEMTITQRWGIEGASFTYDEAGNPQWTEEMLNPPNGYNTMIYKAKYQASVNVINDVRQDYYAYSEPMLEAGTIWGENEDYTWTLPTLTLSSEESDSYNYTYPDIDTYVQETLIKIMYGEKDISEWDTMVQTAKDMGIEDCIALYQAAYDRYLAG